MDALPTLSRIVVAVASENWSNVSSNSNSTYYNETDDAVPYTTTAAPTSAPVSSVTTTNSELQLIRFVIYLIITVMILGSIMYMNNRKQDQVLVTITTTSTDNGAANTNSQQQGKPEMTPEEREEYVKNFLKTQKFIDDDQTIGSFGSNSFRLTKSSTRSLVDNNDDKNIDDDQDNKASDDNNNTSSADNIHADLESGMTRTGSNIGSPSSFKRTKTKKKKTKEYSYCAICLDRFIHDDDICVSQDVQCIHVFHLECLYPWLLKSQDCPCCRRDFLSIVATPTNDAKA